jgi:hypothetical protein
MDQPDRIVISKADEVLSVCAFITLANRDTYPNMPPPAPFPDSEVTPMHWMVEDARTSDNPADCLSLPVPPPGQDVAALDVTGWVSWELTQDRFPCEIHVDVQIDNPNVAFAPTDIGLLAPLLPVVNCEPP